MHDAPIVDRLISSARLSGYTNNCASWEQPLQSCWTASSLCMSSRKKATRNNQSTCNL